MRMKDPFVKLVQDVGGDGGEDVAMRKVLPERIRDCIEAIELELLDSSGIASHGTVDCPQSGYRIPWLARGIISPLVTPDEALWTTILHAAGHEALLRVVANKPGDDGVNVPFLAVRAHYSGAIMPGLHEGTEQATDAFMKDFIVPNFS